MYDIKICGGMVIDGSGNQPFMADVAIVQDKIVAIGKTLGPAKQEISATGCIVTPGFVDIHTHYDGQVNWTQQLAPSTDHGVTTVVMGNCAVGIAPCKADQRDLLINIMGGVEDIPEVVMAEGLPWNWETYPEYLDALAQRECDADFASMIAHGPLRLFVMGQRGADRESATGEDLVKIAAVVKEAIEAGAIGFSTSRTLIHRSVDGKLAPAETASEEELMTIAKAMRDARAKSVLQYISDFPGLTIGGSADFDLMCRFAKTAGLPLSFTLVEVPGYPEGWRQILHMIEHANQSGLRIRGQVAPRAIGLSFGLDLSYHPFTFRKSYREIAHLPLAERVVRMKDPELRARILSEPSVSIKGETVGLFSQVVTAVEQMFRLENPPNYEPAPQQSLQMRAKAKGMPAEAFAYDELLEDGGHAILYFPITNYRTGSLDQVEEMMRHPDTVVALGDGGAHYGLISDASYPTFALTHWVRDRDGSRFTLEEMIRALTRVPAETVCLSDRGLLQVGYKADVNIINMETLALGYPQVFYDLPAGGRRMTQFATGYVATIVSGQVTRMNGESTGIYSGRLVRGTRADPGINALHAQSA
ncbi:MAG: amidohydrolase family protein [Spongiibacteraceae bacterium]